MSSEICARVLVILSAPLNFRRLPATTLQSGAAKLAPLIAVRRAGFRLVRFSCML
jgi:hypothetical protein